MKSCHGKSGRTYKKRVAKAIEAILAGGDPAVIGEKMADHIGNVVHHDHPHVGITPGTKLTKHAPGEETRARLQAITNRRLRKAKGIKKTLHLKRPDIKIHPGDFTESKKAIAGWKAAIRKHKAKMSSAKTPRERKFHSDEMVNAQRRLHAAKGKMESCEGMPKDRAVVNYEGQQFVFRNGLWCQPKGCVMPNTKLCKTLDKLYADNKPTDFSERAKPYAVKSHRNTAVKRAYGKWIKTRAEPFDIAG